MIVDTDVGAGLKWDRAEAKVPAAEVSGVLDGHLPRADSEHPLLVVIRQRVPDAVEVVVDLKAHRRLATNLAPRPVSRHRRIWVIQRPDRLVETLGEQRRDVGDA